MADAAAFMRALGALARPGGMVAVSTLARTPRSYALAIIGAEYIISLVPRGTHDWSRFINPGTLLPPLLLAQHEMVGRGSVGCLVVAWCSPLCNFLRPLRQTCMLACQDLHMPLPPPLRRGGAAPRSWCTK